MAYSIEGMDPAPFAPLFELDDAALASRGIVAVTAAHDDYPCRIALAGAATGDRLLLLNHEHQPAPTPYRSTHAIYVARGSRAKGMFRDQVPLVMQSRMLSIRAFDADDMMIDADIVAGTEAEALIVRLLGQSETAYLHIHFAKRGCFAAVVRRD